MAPKEFLLLLVSRFLRGRSACSAQRCKNEPVFHSSRYSSLCRLLEASRTSNLLLFFSDTTAHYRGVDRMGVAKLSMQHNLPPNRKGRARNTMARAGKSRHAGTTGSTGLFTSCSCSCHAPANTHNTPTATIAPLHVCFSRTVCVNTHSLGQSTTGAEWNLCYCKLIQNIPHYIIASMNDQHVCVHGVCISRQEVYTTMCKFFFIPCAPGTSRASYLN